MREVRDAAILPAGPAACARRGTGLDPPKTPPVVPPPPGGARRGEVSKGWRVCGPRQPHSGQPGRHALRRMPRGGGRQFLRIVVLGPAAYKGVGDGPLWPQGAEGGLAVITRRVRPVRQEFWPCGADRHSRNAGAFGPALLVVFFHSFWEALLGNTPFELTGADPADPHPAFGNILFESNRASVSSQFFLAERPVWATLASRMQADRHGSAGINRMRLNTCLATPNV